MVAVGGDKIRAGGRGGLVPVGGGSVGALSFAAWLGAALSEGGLPGFVLWYVAAFLVAGSC